MPDTLHAHEVIQTWNTNGHREVRYTGEYITFSTRREAEVSATETLRHTGETVSVFETTREALES